jgi:hypothetical protein
MVIIRMDQTSISRNPLFRYTASLDKMMAVESEQKDISFQRAKLRQVSNALYLTRKSLNETIFIYGIVDNHS